MTDTFTFHHGTFQHLILEGSPYEVGFTQGSLLKDSAQAGQAAREAGLNPIHAASPAQYLLATNHYTLGDLPQWNTFEAVMGHSIPRYKAIEACIQQDFPQITPETFRGVLSREFPEGCFCPYYQYWLGTIRSMIFDLTAGRSRYALARRGRTHGAHSRLMAIRAPSLTRPYFPKKDKRNND